MPIGIAIVGVGWIAETVYLPYISRRPELRLRGVFDSDSNRARAIADGFAAKTCSSIYDVVSDANVGLVIICAPNEMHTAYVDIVVRAGKVVVCEKPMCITLQEVNLWEELLPNFGGQIFFSLPSRFREDVRALGRMIEQGSLGSVYKVNARWIRRNGIPQSGWFINKRQSGGGALLDLGSHLMDVVYDMLQYPVVLNHCSATSSMFIAEPNRRAQWHGDAANIPDGDVEDNGSLFVKFDGCAAHVEVGWAANTRHDVTSIEVFGNEGYAYLDTLFGFSTNTPLSSSKLMVANRDGEIREFKFPTCHLRRAPDFVGRTPHGRGDRMVSMDPCGTACVAHPRDVANPHSTAISR